MLQEHWSVGIKRDNPVQSKDLSDTDPNTNDDTSTDSTEVL